MYEFCVKKGIKYQIREYFDLFPDLFQFEKYAKINIISFLILIIDIKLLPILKFRVS